MTTMIPTDVRPLPFPRLTAIELRKSLDTRAGVAVLVLALALSAAALAYLLVNGIPGFASAFNIAQVGTSTLLPVVGVLAMTTEWTQRTALVTFTQVPQRGRVFGAKVTAVLLITVAAHLLVAALTAAAVAFAGPDPAWVGAGTALGGTLVSVACLVLMGVAFGALLQHTAAALVLFFVAPPLWATVGPLLLGDAARWLDVLTAMQGLNQWEISGPAVVALAAWIALPLALGFVRNQRREAS